MSEPDVDPVRLDAVAREFGAAAVRADRPEGVVERLTDALAPDPFPFAWYGTVDADAGRVVPRTRAGDGRGYLDEEVALDGDDPWTSAIDTGTVRVVAFEASGPDWQTRGHDAGFETVAAVPVVGDGDVHGVLTVFTDTAGVGEDGLAELGSVAGHSMDTLEERDRARRGEREARRFERIVRRMPTAVALKDPEGRYRAVNERFVGLVGASESAILGATDEDLFDPEVASQFRARDRQVVESEAVQTAEEEVTLDGRELVFETTRMPYYETDDRKSLAGTVAIHRDLTDRVTRERELRERNERLDTFASVVSHDLRNPLDIAEGYVGKARATGDEDDFDEIEESIRRMKTIIDELLTLARADRQVNDTEELELRTVAEDAWGSVDTGDAALQVEGDRTVTADEGQLQRFLENLFRNSVEHGPADVTVRVGTTSEGFFLADDGPGIPPEDREEAFEPGYTTDDDGTGLGLAIVGRIAEAHGWTATLGESGDGGVRVEVDVSGDGE